MDLHLANQSATDEERAIVDQFGDPTQTKHTGRSAVGLPDMRHQLLPTLNSLQAAVGWISPGAVSHIGERLGVPPADTFGVASFYELIATEPQPRDIIHLCDDIACRLAGAESVAADLAAKLGPEGTGTEVGWKRSGCLGRCDRGPAVYVQRCGGEAFDQGPVVEGLTARPVDGLAELARLNLDAGIARSYVSGSKLLVRASAGTDPASIDAYQAAGGLRALARARDMEAAAIRAEIVEAGLTGRGGAAFPTGRKWEGAAASSGPRYVVANADESEPGTFKDRVLMEADPFALVEGLIVAALAIQAEKGFIYVRGEYPVALKRLQNAVTLMTDHMPPGFEVELRSGAGAYICGEETALFNSIEGFRGEPRNKPPFPTQHGLFGRPTVVNNVETLVTAVLILAEGPQAYRSLGTAQSPGSKLLSVSGRVRTPGVIEVPFGTTLRDALSEVGGVVGRLGAVLLGGAAGSFVVDLDIVLSRESLEPKGLSLGSGAVVVFDDETDFVDIVSRVARFFKEESCGQCVPCRVGTVRQEEALIRLFDGFEGQLELLADVGAVMTDASICGLGQTASSAVLSAVQLGLIGGPS